MTQQSQLSKLSIQTFQSHPFQISHKFSLSPLREPRRVSAAVAEETAVLTQDPSSETARRLYVGNIPRTVNNDELQKIVEEHGAVEKVEVFVVI